MGMIKNLPRTVLCYLLAFLMIILLCAGACVFVMRTALASKSNYAQPAKQQIFITEIRNSLQERSMTLSFKTGLPRELILETLPNQNELEEIVLNSCEEIPQILFSGRQGYTYRFDEAALYQKILAYASSQEAKTGKALDGAYNDSLRETAHQIAELVNDEIRVFDAALISSHGVFWGFLWCVQNALWILCAILAIAVALFFGLRGLAGKETVLWLAFIPACAGLSLLMPFVFIEAAGLHSVAIEPVPLFMLYDSLLSAAQTTFFIIGIIFL
ncbi:MAG: hypothetical protein GXW99_06910 [Clostridiales bacterium]|nr:hypothetical protein [Clostridiales bacterium]